MGCQQEVMRPTKTASLLTKITVAVILLIMMTSFSEAGAATTDDTFVYAGCSPHKYLSGTKYDANVNSLLTSLLTSSSSSSFTNLTSGTVRGLFQCRPDLPSPGECYTCVSTCVSQLGVVCPGSVAAALRLEGCYVKYDNTSFLGVEDKTVVVNNCGPQLQFDSDELARRDSVLAYLESEGGQLFRAGGDGDVQGVAECVVGLSPFQCQDCLDHAVSLLKTDCLYASSGDVYLASCYARYTVTASHAPYTRQTGSTNDGATNDGNTQKTLAIIIGIVVLVGLIVFSAAYLRKHCKDKCDK